MTVRLPRLLLLLAATLSACTQATPPTAATRPLNTIYQGDRILTFGGGPSPLHSQASLEQNVLYFQRVLMGLGVSGAWHDIYFTDGTATGRSIELQTPPTRDSELREYMAALFGDNPGDVQLQFRAPRIPNVTGPSTPAAIANWFATVGPAMRPADKLLIYFTGHGSPIRTFLRNGGAPAPATQPGTLMDTWNETAISTRDFVADLDKINPDVDVTLVMVQCFSGGFANVIYNEGDPAKGISKARRCGFFSTIATRQAAGCTADINGDDYQEFSTSFFAALSGKTRAGKPVERPDYDHDGVTSFTEAFTYVLLNSNTIDIPMTTSDQLLRDKSRFARTGDSAELLKNDVAYGSLIAAATPSQKAALDGLSAQLGLTGEGRLAAARVMAGDINRQRNEVQAKFRTAQMEQFNLRNTIRLRIIQRWPELGSRWRADSEQIMTHQGSDIMAAIRSNKDFPAWEAAMEKTNALSQEDFAMERKWVKTQRFIARAETVILAANLQKVAKPEIVQFYKDLTGREDRTLTDWKPRR